MDLNTTINSPEQITESELLVRRTINSRTLVPLAAWIYDHVMGKLTVDDFNLMTYGDTILKPVTESDIIKAIDGWNEAGFELLQELMTKNGDSFGFDTKLFLERTFPPRSYLPQIEYGVSIKLDKQSDDHDFEEKVDLKYDMAQQKIELKQMAKTV